MTDHILRTRNYYSNIDPGHYYITETKHLLPPKATRATQHKYVYLSDLLNNNQCSVTFGVYRDTDNLDAPKKSADIKSGTVVSYNPETKLLAINCVKKRPSRVSTFFKRTNKLRYVEPEFITVSSISRNCGLRPVTQIMSSPKSTSRSSPKSTSRSSPKSTSKRGGTRKHKRTRRV